MTADDWRIKRGKERAKLSAANRAFGGQSARLSAMYGASQMREQSRYYYIAIEAQERAAMHALTARLNADGASFASKQQEIAAAYAQDAMHALTRFLAELNR